MNEEIRAKTKKILADLESNGAEHVSVECSTHDGTIYDCLFSMSVTPDYDTQLVKHIFDIYSRFIASTYQKLGWFNSPYCRRVYFHLDIS